MGKAPEPLIEMIVSGGQSGVDRAALDQAAASGIPLGGWCPKGRLSEEGVIPDRYPLTETPSESYEQRTEWNVRDSDGTLILAWGEIGGGTAFTAQLARRLEKPTIIVDLREGRDVARVRRWIAEHRIRVLNVAGPRASKEPKVYGEACRFLSMLLAGDA